MTDMPRRLPVPGEIISCTDKRACILETCRVLDLFEGLNRIVLIPVAPRRSKKRIYFVGPIRMELSNVMTDLEKMWINISPKGITPRPDVMASNQELDRKYLRKGQKKSIPRRQRVARYAIIKPLVHDLEKRKSLLDPTIRVDLIKRRAFELNNGVQPTARQIKQISELLNQYFAEGCTPGAVTPFSAAKGGRGKQRRQKNKLGRRNSPTRQGQRGSEGMILTERDKQICGFCWRNYYIRGVTIAKALRRMWRVFYSENQSEMNGKIQTKLLPPENRPTRAQFERWGNLNSPGHEGWKKQLSKFNLNRMDRVLYGTSTDDIFAVGQRGAVDSTTNDVELVAVSNRLNRIGQAHRILIVDSMFGYISGFYMGLHSPSAETVKLAFLHSLTDKTEWLKWIGLEDQSPEDWIPIRYETVLADNTDLRCQEVFEALKNIDTGIKFVGVARSDLNSSVETKHHELHRMVDHNLLGTTYGKKKERGDEPADLLARHTIIEAIRETARAIHTHNTMPLEITPTLEMHRDLVNKGIPLTRLNLTRWKCEQGKRAVSLMGDDEARIKLLPKIKGTFTKRGVMLLRQDRGEKREFIESVRFVSVDPHVIQRVMQAKTQRKGRSAEYFDDDFLINPYMPTEIYYWNRDGGGELIKLNGVSKDSDLLNECVLPDILNLQDTNAVLNFHATNIREEQISNMEHAQELTKEHAQNAYEEALAQTGKTPSKTSIRKNKTQNRLKEQSSLPFGMPVQEPEGFDSGSIQTETTHKQMEGKVENFPDHDSPAPGEAASAIHYSNANAMPNGEPVISTSGKNSLLRARLTNHRQNRI